MSVSASWRKEQVRETARRTVAATHLPDVGASVWYSPDGKPCSITEWSLAWNNPALRFVEVTRQGCWRISTVYLGLDHGFMSPVPLIYETMIFDESAEQPSIGPHPHDGECWRWPSREAAQAGHDRIRQWVGDGMKGEVPQ